MANFPSTVLLSFVVHGIVFAGSIFYYGQGNQKNHKQISSIPITFVSYSANPSQTTPARSHQQKIKTAKSPQKQNMKKSRYIKNKDIENSGTFGISSSNSGNFSDCKPFDDNTHPSYPEEARQQGLEIKFLAHLKINARGNVDSINFSKQNIPQPFIEATKEALKSWRFHRKKNNTVEVSVPIEFVLSNE